MAIETYRLSVQGTTKQSGNEVVMHFASDVDASMNTLAAGEDLITQWRSLAQGAWLGFLPDGYILHRLEAVRVLPSGSVGAHFEYADDSQVGNVAAASVGLQLCPCVRLIPPSGTKTMGKMFLPAISPDSINNNAYDAGYVTDVGTYMSIVINPFGAGLNSWRQVVYSRRLVSSANVLAWSLSPAIGFQGKRRTPVYG